MIQDKVKNVPFFFVNKEEVQGVRDGKWKLHTPHKYRVVITEGKDGMPGNQDNFGGAIDLSLFNVEKDPSESENVAKKYPEKVKYLQDLIVKFELDLKNNSRPAGVVE